MPLVEFFFAVYHSTVSPFFWFRGAVGEACVKWKLKAIAVEQNAATIKAVAVGAKLLSNGAI